MAREPRVAEGDTFEHDTCLYRGDGGEEARVFRAGEDIPPVAEGWRDHPSLCPTKG